ncbi:MAG: alkaline phosphatase [Desulfovibrio sp.]|uniref:alkaline phosphatase n=1 Tax=Desulfovibrio sp. 7SRBS1 TaxID=3378064 RepID=UPI003B3E868D
MFATAKRSFTALLLTALAVAAFAVDGAQAKTAMYKGAPAKYVFFFIGDGMGIPQRSATQAFTNTKMEMDKFPAQGVTTTFANDRFITGSAASATALASGQKTNINYIGVDPNYKPVQTVAEIAKSQGKKVGIVSSVSIDHATPAAFYAHVPTRKMYHEIDHALAMSGFDYFGGGGMIDPTGKKSKKPLGDARILAQKNGYKIIDNKKDFEAAKPGQKIIAWNHWLQDDQALPYVMDITAEDITLPEFTAKGIELLDNDKGFFMMVEGGKIDWACHANDAAAALRNTVAFDLAIQEAVKFYKKHPNDTLIVVTGDHECGGLTLGFAGTKYESDFNLLANQMASFTKFDQDVMAPYKKAHGADAKFEDLMPVITENFGFTFTGDAKKDPMVLKPYEITQLKDAFKRSMSGEKIKDPQGYLLYGGYEPLTITLTHLLNNKSGLAWTSYKHTGVPVTTSALGVGSETFNGYYDNTDVAKKIKSVMGVAPQVVYLSK